MRIDSNNSINCTLFSKLFWNMYFPLFYSCHTYWQNHQVVLLIWKKKILQYTGFMQQQSESTIAASWRLHCYMGSVTEEQSWENQKYSQSLQQYFAKRSISGCFHETYILFQDNLYHSTCISFLSSAEEWYESTLMAYNLFVLFNCIVMLIDLLQNRFKCRPQYKFCCTF